jgi:hypothetical protein
MCLASLTPPLRYSVAIQPFTPAASERMGSKENKLLHFYWKVSIYGIINSLYFRLVFSLP